MTVIKKTTLLLAFLMVANLAAQKDTLYFNINWKKTDKYNAAFFRPIPLKKVGDLYQIKDYYINGSLQMDGYWPNIEEEINEGETKWYYKNGQLSEVKHYTKGILNGETLFYSKNGYLRAKGTYRDNEYWAGTFYDECCYNGYILEYLEGKKTGQLMYYADSDEIAVKRTIKNDSTIITNYFDKKGNNFGYLTTINQIPKEGMLAMHFLNSEDDVLSLKQYSHYKNGNLNGEVATYTDKGKLLAKCNYKNDEPYSGTNFSYSTLKTYVKGKLEGKEIGYSKNKLPITNGINKDDEPWQGQFISYYDEKISNYKKGELEGKQITYFTGNYEQIKSYYHILNHKKEGESALFNNDGEQQAKGIYKDDEPWDGTFYDAYNNLLSSFKDGKKHGMFTQYNNNGEIIAQQEYEEDLLTGNVKSYGRFENKECNCIYKKGTPYSGLVCKDLSIVHYENGFTIKKENYSYNYETEVINFNDAISYDNQGNITAKTIIADGKTYALSFKDGKPYNGVSYADYEKEIITYKNGKREGLFVNLINENRDLKISGHFKNDLMDGIIHFYNTNSSLDNQTSCTYSQGKPITGTVIKNNTETPYKNGLKHGVEKEIIYNELQEEDFIKKITTYDKGLILEESWPNEKNYLGHVVKGVYKNGKPFNGDFYEFEPVTASLSHYKNGVISGTQYIGLNDNQHLMVTDSMQYKLGKPHQGKSIEYYKDRLHFHEYTHGKVTKTVVTRDDLNFRVRNTIRYSDSGFIVSPKDSNLVMFRATYLNEDKTKAKVDVYTDTKGIPAGTLEYDTNKINAIEVNFNEGGFQINYALINSNLVITLKRQGLLLKAYPVLDSLKQFTYKNFLNSEQLFTDNDIVIDTYIDGKKLATGVIKDKDMYDGIHIRNSRDKATIYSYYKYNKGKRIVATEELTKKALLKLLNK